MAASGTVFGPLEHTFRTAPQLSIEYTGEPCSGGNPTAEGGIPLDNRSWKTVRQFIETRCGIRPCRGTCTRYLHLLGFVYKRSKKRLLVADEEERAAFVEAYAPLPAEVRAAGVRSSSRTRHTSARMATCAASGCSKAARRSSTPPVRSARRFRSAAGPYPPLLLPACRLHASRREKRLRVRNRPADRPSIACLVHEEPNNQDERRANAITRCSPGWRDTAKDGSPRLTSGRLVHRGVW